MANRRARREEEIRRKAERDARIKFYFALAVSLFSWGYKAIAREPNVYFGSILNTFAFVLFARAFWEDFDWPRWIKTVVASASSVAFVIVFVLMIRIALRPSFVFLFPGAVMNGGTWDFIVNQRGPETLYAVEFLFIDEDKAAELRKRKEITPSDLASMQQSFRFPEVNPKGRGSIFARQFLWKPSSFEHEHFSVEITTRNARFHEDMRIEKASGKWLEGITVKDAEKNKILLVRGDDGFPHASSSHEKLPRCFPEITLP